MKVKDMDKETLNWAVSKALGLKSLPPLSSFGDERLPYDFDLLYDIKYWREIRAVLYGEDHLHKSDATIENIIHLAHDLGYSIDVDINYFNWKSCGPIIENNGLSPYFDGAEWRCQVGGADDNQCQGFVFVGSSYFESALKCYVASKLGLEIDLVQSITSKVNPRI